MNDLTKDDVYRIKFDCLKKAISMLQKVDYADTSEYWYKVTDEAEKIYNLKMKIRKEVH